ncbi:MAG: GNAT family N-acetyltransferase [Winogradskyella sp.]|uniref:GNAT family N-acetyltransferase n=1 Tax=Winogradskyella sp. TaxID=1883156 RepID=UPI000F3E41D6|nr:GNAT family N-acetyltransferase [Winogradskyella sp.]RNC84898.1 MAG: GNAT family N-acetyltransferase [Winogradskyella sp.]
MITITRATSKHQDFIDLVKQLDAYLKVTDGDDHAFYNQYNSIESLNHVVIAYYENKPIGCGAFKEFNENSVEVKRMYVLPKSRVNGVGKQILNALEIWAKDLGYNSCVLETGKRQIEAVQFYKKCNYTSIPRYGQYQQMENSLCFEKQLK